MNTKTMTVILFAAVAAHTSAATLSLRWQHTSDTKITLAPSQTAVIEVVLEGMLAGDTLSRAYFSLQAIQFDPITHVSTSVGPTGWIAGGAVGVPLGDSQFDVSSDMPGSPDDLAGPSASAVLGSFTIHLEDVGLPDGAEMEIAFNPVTHSQNQLVKSDGSFWIFNHRGYAAYSGYWTYGRGSPGIGTMGFNLPRDPLVITKIPEPTSLALFFACGVAFFMRQPAGGVADRR